MDTSTLTWPLASILPSSSGRSAFGIALFLALLLSACELLAQTPPTPVPPSKYVYSGRTYDPGEALVTPMRSGARAFHVSLTGNDSNAGTAAQPFRTIQRALNALSSGNDTVLIHGGLYRERLSLLFKSAPAGNPFVIGPAGDGEVILDGSTAVTGWTAQGGNIFQVRPGFAVGNVVIDNQPLYKEASLTALQANPTVAGVPVDARYFFNATSGDLYVRVSGASPAARDVGVIKDVTNEDALFLYSCNNYIIYGLTVRFTGGRGINIYGGDNTVVQQNKVVFNRHTGLTTGRLDNAQRAANARLIKNYVYFNFMLNWPRGNGGYVWGGWGSGIGMQGSPFALAEGNISEKNGGEGILTYDGEGGTTFRHNVSADNWSVNFYYDNLPNGVIEGNLAVGHRPDLANIYNNGWASGSDGYYRAVRLSRPIGIMTADEDYGKGANLNNVTIRNNVIVNTRKALEHYSVNSLAASSGLKNIKVVNNTILVPSDRFTGFEDDLGGISIPYNNGNNTGSFYQNNIIMGGDAQAFHLRMVQEAAITELFRGLTIDHNLFDAATGARPFLWGGNWGVSYTHVQWLALAGAAHGAGDLLGSANLVNASSDNALDKQPQSGSIAIDAGATFSFVTTDFLGTGRPSGSAYDIGAFEFSSGGTSATAAPSFTPAGGTYTSAQTVSLSTTTAGASIRYTTDGSTPTSTVGTMYSTSLTISTNSTLKALAYKSGLTDSAVTSATYTITLPDTTPPSVPTNLAGTATSTTQVNLTWTAATDNVAVTGYRLYRDNIQIATGITSLAHSDSALTPSTTYAYSVAAYDAAGNLSARSAAFNVTTPAPPPPAITLAPLDVAGLINALTTANANPASTYTINLADRTYALTTPLPNLAANNLTIQGPATNTAILEASALATGPIFNVTADQVKFSKLTFRNARNRAITIQPGADQGRIENCTFANPTAPQPSTAAIDGRGCLNWTLTGNTSSNIVGATATAEPAIHFYDAASGTTLTFNLILNCDRAIGLGSGPASTHVGGKIQNNFIADNRATGGFPGPGISLESASAAQVDNNSVYQAGTYANAIEYRYPGTTGAFIRNNLANRAITARDNAPLATLATNHVTAQAAWFTAPPSCDLHLTSALSGVVNSGTTITGLATDIDGDPRPSGTAFDIGADEYTGSATPPPQPPTPEPTPPPAPAPSPSPTNPDNPGGSGGGGGAMSLWFIPALAALTSLRRFLISKKRRT